MSASRNVVVCCDGTANQYGDSPTNVLRLFAALPKGDPMQPAFYDPGVGTLRPPRFLVGLRENLRFLQGLAFGRGLRANAEDAYRFLMNTYQDGDRVFLFGFSRGAYTARVVAAWIHKCGLLLPGNENLIPYSWHSLRHHTGPRAAGFQSTFSRAVPIHFLGLWDTVSSVGLPYSPRTFPHTRNNPSVRVVRHAVALEERRADYRTNLWSPLAGQDVQEVWFAGVHSDVGGGYPPKESGLAQIALEWMLTEAGIHGLRTDATQRDRVLGRMGAPTPNDPLVGVSPNSLADKHESLRRFWHLLELLPRVRRDPARGFAMVGFRIPRGRLRTKPPGAVLHASVAKRQAAGFRVLNVP